MKRFFVATVLVFALARMLAACTVLPKPLPPPDGPGDCASACATLSKLGGCGADMTVCQQDCEAATRVEAEIGVRWPAHCLTVAESCEAALRCQ